MKKILSLLMLLTVAIPSLMAEEKSFTIMLDKTTAESSTAVTSDNFISSLVSSGSEYFTVTEATKVYPGENSAKLGSSKAVGSFTLAITAASQFVPTKVVLNAKQYGSDTGKLEVVLNGKTSTFGSSQSPTSGFSDLEYSDANFTETVKSIKVSTTTKRANVKSITVYYEEQEVGVLGTPVIDVTGGTYDVEKTVTITAADGAEVRYTTNDESDIKGGVEGVDYTVGNTVLIDKSCTLRVVAVKDGGFSPVVTETYVMKTAKPEITMGDDKKVSITTDYQNGVTIYYTTDGTTVTAESEVYSEPFTIARGSVVKAVAKYKEFDLSDEVSFNYTQERSVVFAAESTSDFPGIEDKAILDDTDFTKDGIIVRFEKGTSSSNPNLYYVNEGQIRFYKNNLLKISAEGSAIISSVEFKTTTTASYLLKSPQLSSGTYTNDGASGVWKDINAQSATLTNVTQQARLLSIKVNYIVPEEAANVLKINEEGAYYVVNFTLEGVKENGGVLYARTADDSVEPSDPKKNFFDKGYEDYDLTKFTQRDWVAIAGLKSDYAGKQIATGFVASYDGTKLVPVTEVVPVGDGASVALNTFGVANVFYGNYENTEGLKMQGGYQPFFVKAKVNEVANFLGSVKLNDGKYELWGSGVCGKMNEKGLEIEANGTDLAESATYKQIEGVLVKDEAANGGVKLIAMNVKDTPTGVESLKANGKAAIYGTEGAVVVAGADGKVAIFDAMGRMVKSVSAEGAATVEMPAGYYIVRTAGTAKAVIVK